ncbi:MAG: restriction endonuclease subunit S [Bacteroidetes bacterium]|nr:restriction endonuclease subunit S [Bacteroidota bacterium]
MEESKLVTIEDVCKSGSSNVSQNKLENIEGIYPIYGASGLIKNVDFYHQENPYLSIVKDGSGYGRITKMPEKTSVIGTLQYLLPKDNILLDYLYYGMQSIDFKKYVSGAAIPHIYFKDYKKEPILLRPIEEQKTIVAKLDQAFAAIDQAKANIEKNIANAKELFQSKLNQIFSKKGEGWEEKRLSDITNIINGFAFSSKDFKKTNPVKSIKITNVGVNSFVFDNENNLPLSCLEKNKSVCIHQGDIVIALTRTIISSGLKVAIVPKEYDLSLLNQRVAAIREGNSLKNSYLYYFLTSKIAKDYVLEHVNTLMQPNLSINDLKKFPVNFPKLETQQQIVNQLDQLQEQTNLLVTKYQQKLANLQELKKSILEKAFKGELS